MRAGGGPRFWSNVLAVAYREAAVLRHDRAFLSLVAIQPLMMLTLFGFVLSNEPANVPWAVWDQNQTAVSRRLVRDIEATGYFLAPRAVEGYDAGRTLLREGKILAFLVIPKRLRRDIERGRPRVQLLVDGSDPLSAARVAGYVGEVAAVFEAGGAPAQRPRGTVAATPAGARIDVRQRFWFNPTLADNVFFLGALAAMLLTNFCLSATSLGLVGERESGTYEHMLSLPTTALEIVLGKLLPHVLVGFGLLVYATLATGLVFGIWPAGSFVTLALVTLPFVLASLSIGVYVSTLARTSAQAVFITVFFIMPSFVLSGVMFPYQLMPDGVRHVGYLFPLRWYQIAARRIVARGAGLDDVLVPAAALLVIFAALLVGIRRRMKPRLG
jgi:ABC-2 type transport system permease protein